MRKVITITALIILTACSPSEQAIQEAIDATKTAVGAAATATATSVPPSATATLVPPSTTATKTLAPTDTPVPSPTNTPTPTETPTATPTASPTATPDLRIIEVESKHFLLESKDLPKESQYFLPNSGWISPDLNTEILSGWGQEEGMVYLEATGRIEGYWVYLARGSVSVRAPEEIYHNIIRYETAQGAILTITEYSKRPGYELIDTELAIGDLSYVYFDSETQPNGRNKVWYSIDTAYRNYVSNIRGFGWEEDVTPKYMKMVGQIIIDKLEAAPLVEP